MMMKIIVLSKKWFVICVDNYKSSDFLFDLLIGFFLLLTPPVAFIFYLVYLHFSYFNEVAVQC